MSRENKVAYRKLQVALEISQNMLARLLFLYAPLFPLSLTVPSFPSCTLPSLLPPLLPKSWPSFQIKVCIGNFVVCLVPRPSGGPKLKIRQPASCVSSGPKLEVRPPLPRFLLAWLDKMDYGCYSEEVFCKEQQHALLW